MDALYGPLYYRLLISRAPLTTEYADEVTDMVWAGMVCARQEFKNPAHSSD
jgi:hypothetical protein